MQHLSNCGENKIDFNLYSRQLEIIDLDTMKKLTKMNFLIIGLRGLGVEIAKDLILEGPNRVDIYDPNYIHINDLNSNFMITEEDINKERDEIIIEKMRELNSNVECDIIRNINNNENNYENELKFLLSNIPNYNMIIITEFVSKNSLVEINNYCRKLNKGLIYTCALGLCGFLFNDFGKKHIITNPYGKDDNFYPIKNIKKGEKTIIEVENSMEGFPDIGDTSYIKLNGINGMTELNNKTYKVKFLSVSEYEIDINSTNYNDYLYGGFLRVESIPETIEFRTFEEDLLNPIKNKEKELFNTPYIGRNDIIHSLVIALHHYENNNNKIENIKNKKSFVIDSNILPELNDENKSNEITNLAKKFYNISKMNKESWIQQEDIYDETSEFKEFDEEMCKNLSLYLKAEIPPIVSFLGGIVAQEIIKLTGKFSPFEQWFEFEFNYLSKENNNKNYPKEINEVNEVSRYNEQIQIFGKEVQNKLSNLNIFLIGAGAIGCEYLKNFAMMGISCKNNKDNKFGTLTVTDFDKIELSNLNRQFLFRENNMGQYKSEVAKNLVSKMNNSFNIKSYINLVSPDTENIFSDIFWDRQDIIFNAVDNVKARMYINEKVAVHQKYHVDAGTLGVHSSCCFFLKNLSTTYKEQNPEKKEEDDSHNGETGMCTIHSFPTSIRHCIEWSRNEYAELFFEFIAELKQIISGNYIYLYKLLIKKIFPFYKNLKIEEFNKYLEIFVKKSYKKAIEYSYIKFKNKFNYNISDILKEHPENSKDEKGNYFYIGSKHVPKILDFNINENIDNLILCYIKSFSNLIFETFGLEKTEEELNLTDDEIKLLCLNTTIPNYDKVSKKSMISKIVYDKKFCQDYIIGLQNNLIKELDSLDNITLKQIIFTKDNIQNNQFDFIYACTNLRAINFQIPQLDYLKIKNISSKIIPSIITSNAVITGLSSMQLYLLAKLMLEKEKKDNDILNNDETLKLFRHYHINLGLNGYNFTYLSKKILHNEENDIPLNWTSWDSIDLYGPLTIKQFYNYIEEKYNVKISSIHSGNAMIYSDGDNIDIENIKIEELYKEITKKEINFEKKYLIFNLIAKTKDENTAKMPRIKYHLNIL